MLALLASCKPKDSSDQKDSISTSELSTDAKTLEAEVMKVHDEVMPKMSDIQHLTMQLRDRKTKAPMAESGKPDYPAAVDMNLTNLKEAEIAMMDWMKEYSDRFSKIAPDSTVQFLQQELVKINDVKTTMLSSIEEASAWLTTNPATK